jgi:putative salt-induced outer membrane protein
MRMTLKGAATFLALLHFGSTFLAADQVILKNGDRATGSIVSKTGDTLTVKSAHFGTITIPWAEVQQITTENPVTVVLPNGESLKGPVTTRDGSVAVVTPDKEQRVPISELVTLRDAATQATYERLLRPAWTDLWAGGAAFGLAGTQGNAETNTLTAAVVANRLTNTDKTSVYFNAIKASALVDGLSAETARAIRGGIAYSHNITARTFWSLFNDYEYDRFQNLDLRVVAGGGLGFIAWKGERGRLDLLAGASWNRETFAALPPEPGFTRNSAEAYFGDDFTYKLTSVTALTQSLRVFPNLSDGGQFRANFDLGATTRLLRWLTWNITISDRYLSNPIPGRQKNDFLYQTSIGVLFAR